MDGAQRPGQWITKPLRVVAIASRTWARVFPEEDSELSLWLALDRSEALRLGQAHLRIEQAVVVYDARESVIRSSNRPPVTS